MKDCRVKKKFGGLDVGNITQLTDEQYQQLSSDGFVEALVEAKPKTEAVKNFTIENKKGNKK
ncbi:MAG: hypothetical protein ACKODS_06015 [Methylophilaceae bacterium]